jgi:uncharacterized protein (TIGR03067 family)
MRFLTLAVFISALLLASSSLAVANQDKEKTTTETEGRTGLDRLRGCWYVVEATRFGPKRMVFEGDTITIVFSETSQKKYRIKVDPMAEPAHFEVFDDSAKSLGIYEVRGGTLRICVSNWQADRPAAFKPGKGVFLLTGTQKKPEPEDHDGRAYAAIRKHGAFADRADKRRGRPIIAVDFNGFSTGMDFDDKHLREMAPLLAKLKHLEQLDLGGTGVSDAGMKDVAKFKQLRVLWLAGTAVTDDGLKELAALEQLNSLLLANDKITGVGFRHLAALKNLESLTLRGLSLTNAGVKELAALQQLQRLDLFESSVNDAGVKELARLKQLAWLNLSGTKVTHAGLKELSGHKNLRTLRLYKTRVTVVAINDLQKGLPHCRIEITAESKVEPELTPEVAKQALLRMMRSKPGKALGFFGTELVDEMAKIDFEKKKDGYHWTGAYRFNLNPGKRTTYKLFVSLRDDAPPLRPHPKGYLIHLRVYQGSFEMNDGRWIATVPKYKYTLLD